VKGYRRLSFVVLTLAVTTTALFKDQLSGAEFTSYLQWLGGFYIGSDVAEKFAGVWKKPSPTPPSEKPNEGLAGE